MWRFDLVGADGLHSHVRQIVFGAEEPFLHDLGMYLCVFWVPNYVQLDRMEVQYSEIGRVAAFRSTREEADAKACFGFAARTPVELRDRAEQEGRASPSSAHTSWPASWPPRRVTTAPPLSSTTGSCARSSRRTRNRGRGPRRS
jgi:2-polyprenyl-6-methoxyphenol hydroxylase-like FAD-dependent oxidoreductase